MIDHDAIAEKVRNFLTTGQIFGIREVMSAYLDLYDEVMRLRAALTIYAQSGNWRLGGCCDPNSPNFTGEAIARAALKGDSDE